MTSGVDRKQLIHDGFGTAGKAVQHAALRGADRWSKCGPPPCVVIADCGTWKTKHAAAGLVPAEEVGTLKAIAAAAGYREAGWRADACIGDVRSRPRTAYRNAITIAATDSHACKCSSVQKSLQVQSPAIAIGLGPDEAVVEFFSPGSGGYCCCHRHNREWNRRTPCEEVRARTSTTAVAWSVNPRSAMLAGELAVDVVLDYLNTSHFPGGTGAHVVGDHIQWFAFNRDENCEEPHDVAFTPAGHNIVSVSASPHRLSVSQLLELAGQDACYADRELAWHWACAACGRTDQFRVHTVHPPKPCDNCGSPMQPGIEQATGLTHDEIRALHDDGPLSLAGMGLADEAILRCASTATGEIVWVHLIGEER
ncbi:MAG: hypothetical protein FJ276_06535 [Planctomycetes bacterium]|nr:hypothetical protein [Planctomycetota bacterium]